MDRMSGSKLSPEAIDRGQGLGDAVAAAAWRPPTRCGRAPWVLPSYSGNERSRDVRRWS